MSKNYKRHANNLSIGKNRVGSFCISDLFSFFCIFFFRSASAFFVPLIFLRLFLLLSEDNKNWAFVCIFLPVYLNAFVAVEILVSLRSQKDTNFNVCSLLVLLFAT
jgi:hypothetical protein